MARKLDRSPNASLRRVGTSTRATVDRIVCTYLEATAEDIAEGAAWYGDAREVAECVAQVGGISIEHAAAVIAHLSPRTGWGTNVAGAFALVTGRVVSRCLPENVARARASLLSDNPTDTFGPYAPKTRAFCANILGNRHEVTVDVWALRLALGGDRFGNLDNVVKRAGVYDAIAHSFRLAAARLGVDPVTVQATTWITYRRVAGGAFNDLDIDPAELARADEYAALAETAAPW